MAAIASLLSWRGLELLGCEEATFGEPGWKGVAIAVSAIWYVFLMLLTAPRFPRIAIVFGLFAACGSLVVGWILRDRSSAAAVLSVPLEQTLCVQVVALFVFLPSTRRLVGNSANGPSLTPVDPLAKRVIPRDTEQPATRTSLFW